ncbi:MAG: tetratricopeptide repeat protein [Candidatus Thermoplasmatota archaeon]|nr:tetratricopeptide repeat protein [Candidatus Thermoplasmatota archaeon]
MSISDTSARNGSAAGAAEVLSHMPFDGFVSVCTSAAALLGVRVQNRVFHDESFVLTGESGGKSCSVICLLPGIRANMRRIAAAARREKRKGRTVIVLSAEKLNFDRAEVDRAVTGEAFVRLASKTADYTEDRRNAAAVADRSGKGDEKERRFRDMMMYARGRFDAGDFDEVIKTLDLLANFKPGSEEVYRLRGLVYLREGRNDEAAEQFDMAITLNSRNADNWFGKASALYQKGDYAGEIECYDMILKIDPMHRRALQNKGVALQNLGRPGDAARVYERALRYSPHDSDLLRNLSLAYYGTGDTGRAIALLDGIISRNASDERAIRTKGLILAEQNMQGAIETLKRYLEMREEAAVIAVVASLYLRQGDLGEAEAYSKRALETDRENEIALQTLEEIRKQAAGPRVVQAESAAAASAPVPAEAAESGVAHAHAVENRAAAFTTRSASRLTSEEICDIFHKEFADVERRQQALFLLSRVKTAEAETALGRILREGNLGEQSGSAVYAAVAEKFAYQSGDFGLAANIAEQRIAAGDAEEWKYRLISSLFRQSRFEQTIPLCLSLPERTGMELAGVAYLMLGRYSKGARTLRKCGGNSSIAANCHGILQMRSGNYQEALDLYTGMAFRNQAEENNRAIALYLRGDRALAAELLSRLKNDGLWQHRYNLAMMLMENGRYAEAAREMRAAADLEKSALTATGLGTVLALSGNLAEAKRELENALSLDSGYYPAVRALRKVNRLMARSA